MFPPSSRHEYTVLLPLSEKREPAADDLDDNARTGPGSAAGAHKSGSSTEEIALCLKPLAKGKRHKNKYSLRDSSDSDSEDDNFHDDDSEKNEMEYGAAHRRARSATRRRFDRLRIALIILATVLATLISRSALSHLSSSTSWKFTPPEYGGPLPAIVVGPRTSRPVRQHCSAPEFADAFRNVVLPKNAPSRHVNWTIPGMDESQELPPFRFSWVVPGCDQPHIYTRDEACDVLAAYRGIFMAGDSFVRHVWDALLLFLTNDIGGAILSDDAEVKESCRGDRLFNDRRPDWSIARCRGAYAKDIRMLDNICPGREIAGMFSDQNKGFNIEDFDEWRGGLPHSGRSIIRLDGAGVHYRYRLDMVNDTVLQPLFNLKQDLSPAPVLIWNAIHSPGDNILAHYYDEQGRPSVRNYNEALRAVVDEQGESYLDGGVQIIPWYNATEGAESFDGQHYSLQVNLEKVQILLNMLDLIWRDAAERGGLDESS